MSSLMEKVTGERAHVRSIDITTYPVSSSEVILEGRLTDDRLRDYYLITGEKRPAGEIHNMAVRLLIDITSMKIMDLEVDMIQVPREQCQDVRSGLEVIRGLVITRGFSLKVRSLLGGAKGCAHLVSLLLDMAPAALQGIWSYKSQNPPDVSSGKSDRIRINKMADTLVNSCYVWRDDGPVYEKLKNTISSLVKSG